MGNQKTELEFLSLLHNDKINAFDDLYWMYQKAVFRIAFKLVRNTLIAEDIVQEVFISLWEKRHTIESSRSVAGWLFVSTYNRSINVLKKQLQESLAIKHIGDPEFTKSDHHEISEIQFSILEDAVNQLSPQKKRVFELCKFQGMSYEETAKEMKISKHTVKEYLAEAMSSVKEYARQHPLGSIAIAILVDAFNS